MRVRFWGVRGSIPVAGIETCRWGGNSSCLEVRHGDHPPLVLDCGTGARQLGALLVGDGQPRVDVVFTHLHMDHLFGLPYFAPVYTDSMAVGIHVPARSEEDVREMIGRFLNGSFHPVRLSDLGSNVTYSAVQANTPFQVGAFEVIGHGLNHPGGSMGYCVSVGGERMAYMTDTAPFAPSGEGLAAGEDPTRAEQRIIEFLRDCDLVVYDTMYSETEYLEKATWGHSYPEYAYAIAKAANVKRLVLFHHRPDASDEELDRLSQAWEGHSDPEVVLAREGEVLEVTSSST